MCSFLRALVSEPSSLCMHMHSAALSSHGGLDKHAKLGGRWKAGCLRLVSLSVCGFCILQLDWHGLSNNMAGRQNESLVGFYPLKWYSIIFDGLSLPESTPHNDPKVRVPFTLKYCVAWSHIKIIVLICPVFVLAMTLIGGDRAMRIKNLFWGMLTKFEPQIPWLTIIGFQSGHHGKGIASRYKCYTYCMSLWLHVQVSHWIVLMQGMQCCIAQGWEITNEHQKGTEK